MNQKEVLSSVFGFSSFRSGQEEIVDHILSGSGEDGTLVIMPTGGGKSLTFQIPCIMSSDLCIVVSPLISLMKDQVDSLKGLGVAVECINSTQSLEEVKAILRKVHRGEIKILYVAPERFKNSLFRGVVERLEVDLFVIDESHCISQWGKGFRPSYRKILEAIEWIKPKRVVALTATANKRVREDIKTSLGIEKATTFCSGFHRDDLDITVEENLRVDDVVNRVLEWYDPETASTTGIVYTATRKEAETICGLLKRYKVPVYFYHAGVEGSKRCSIQEEWMKNGGIIVSTNAFGMGIDKSDVRFVINYGIPNSIEEWYQEIGRGSRDGKGCYCLLVDNGDGMRKFLLEMEYPSVMDIYSFASWLEKNKSKGTIKMTQEKMGIAAGVKSCFSGGCVRFFLREGWMRKIKNGLYGIEKDKVRVSGIDISSYKLLKAEKYEELKELREFIDTDRDKMELFCEYFE